MRTLAALLALVAAAPASAQDVNKPPPTGTTIVRPAPPTNVVATKTGASQITITWDPVPGATSYQIGRYVPPNGWVRISQYSVTVPRVVDQNRDLSVQHQYRVMTIVGSLASLPALSNTVLPTDPIGTVTSLRSSDPPVDTTAAGGGTSTGAPNQTCQTTGIYTTCVTPLVSFSPIGGDGKGTAVCPQLGQVATGGGFAGNLQNMTIWLSAPVIGTAQIHAGWTVSVGPINVPSADPVALFGQVLNGVAPRSLMVFVVCAPGAPSSGTTGS